MTAGLAGLSDYLADDWREPQVPEGYTVALVGDIIASLPIGRLLARDSQDLLDLLGSADLVVGNFEGTILDLRTFEGSPAAMSGFGWLMSPPAVAPDLAGLGFDLLSRANNHSTDWGALGMRSTDEHLLAAGIEIAGTGRNLSAARAPAFHDGVRARASLVSFTTTFEKDSPAADALGEGRDRPGASTLGLLPLVRVSRGHLETLRAIRDAQPEESRAEILMRIDQQLGVVTLFGQMYAAHDDDATVVEYVPSSTVLGSILLNVRQAKQTSDLTVVASHTHEPDNWTTTPPAFLPDVARQAFASGADVFVSHGPHQLRGIEIVDGRPAFYSLANFCFSDNAQAVAARAEWENPLWALAPHGDRLDPATVTPAEFFEWKRVETVFAEDVWFESVIPVLTYGAHGRVARIDLHPIDLRPHGRDAERGIPRLAPPGTAARILHRLRDLSAPFGTVIDVDPFTGAGVIHLPRGAEVEPVATST